MHSPSTDISFSAAAGKKFVPFLRRSLRAVGRSHSVPRLVSVALVGDATMSKLHQRFLGIPGPTDVLTFDLDRDARGRCTAGEVVVCVPEATRQSKRLGTRVEDELLLYLVHGILHLTGHDDRDEASHRRMHRAEDRILVKLGIGPVFEPAPAPRKKANGSRP